MIDHATARSSLATSLDFALDGDASEALQGHLRDCPACQAFGAGLRSDSTALRGLDFGALPIAVRANVAIAAGRHGRGGTGRWAAMAAVGAILVVALGAMVVGGGRRHAAPTGR